MSTVCNRRTWDYARWSMVALALAVTAASSRAQIVATPQKKSGVYELGEKIIWQIEVQRPKDSGSTKPAAEVKELAYVLKRDGLTPYKDGVLDVSGGKATLETSLDKPGSVLLELLSKGGAKQDKVLAGVLVAPEKIQPTTSPPADFDDFWAAKIKDLEAIPANAQLEAADGGQPDIEYFKLQMDNINGSRIYGQLAKPKKDRKFPALLIVQWAGVYRLQKPWVTDRAKQGWLTLNIEPHDLPFDKPDEFYQQASKTSQKDYTSIGSSDREKSYFLRMYLSCYRAAEYLAHRPDWDGKTLVVMGTSQGGQQSFVTAGLHPKVTAMIANVPAGCDVTGPKAGRAAGFPYWADQVKWTKNEQILKTGQYYDAANFARRFKGPALVSMGLIDETCPPTGVYAALNQVQGPREAVVLVNSDHQGRNGSQGAFYSRAGVWLQALAKGEPVPAK
ncbi:acetylxylan esterase [Fimbriiglobus ruber]|uniref:acetylxylan esterase n=1 Tax=Fimbriiglobus ruber TaxID=1908690 RepID=UPI00137B4471|nr:acetylxylan esterase [Fimbriiglobus ruber]